MTSSSHLSPAAYSGPLPQPISVRQLSRSVVLNQLLFTSGYTLTSGGFLTYFVADLGAGAHLIAWILALPELVGIVSVSTPWLVRLAARKMIFLTSSLLARLLAMLIPLLALLPDWSWRLEMLVGVLGIVSILQAISFTSYLSWLSVLAPEKRWGRFLAKRNMAHVGMLMVIPFVAALIRDNLRNNGYTEWQQTWGYVLFFGLGNLLQLISLWPMLRWPAGEEWATGEISLPQAEQTPQKQPAENAQHPEPQRFAVAALSSKPLPVFNRGFVFVLCFSWWLAFFQGFTQTAFFLHSYRQLQLSLTDYYLLVTVMYLLQMATTWMAGEIGDRRGYRNLLLTSTLIVSLAMIFWCLSLNGNGLWLWGAYVLWGGFGAVNLALQNVVLKVAPRRENTLSLALSRYGAGFIAGFTGVIGGIWLDSWITHKVEFHLGPWTIGPFLLLFLVSFAGRFLAPFWLLGMPRDDVPIQTDSSNEKAGTEERVETVLAT